MLTRYRTTIALLSFLCACGKGPEESPRDGAPHAAQPAALTPRAPTAPSGEACNCRYAPKPPEETAAAPERKRESIPVGTSPVRGAVDAPVTIVVFTDFQCPFCARLEPRLLALEERYRGKVRVVFKNQPLPMHPNARLAARAALAAEEQGRFWEMHDALFASRTDPLDRAAVVELAKGLRLSLGRFEATLDAESTDARVASDVVEAHRLGVTGTPTVFINGRRIVGAQPQEVFAAMIDEELAARQ